MPSYGRGGIPEAGRLEGGSPASRGRPAFSRPVRPRGAPRGFPFPPQSGAGVRFRPGGGRLFSRDGIRGRVESRAGGGAGASPPPSHPSGRLASLGGRYLVGSCVPSREGGRAPRRIPGEYSGRPQRGGKNHGFRYIPGGRGWTGERGNAGRKIRVPRPRADFRGRCDLLVRPVRGGSNLRGTAPRSKAVQRGRAGRDLGQDPAIRRADIPAPRRFLRAGGSSAEVRRGAPGGSIFQCGRVSCRARAGLPTPGIGPVDGGFLGRPLPCPAGGGDGFRIRQRSRNPFRRWSRNRGSGTVAGEERSRRALPPYSRRSSSEASSCGRRCGIDRRSMWRRLRRL